MAYIILIIKQFSSISSLGQNLCVRLTVLTSPKKLPTQNEIRISSLYQLWKEICF